MKIFLEVEGASREELEKYYEIVEALIRTGGLTGMKNGATIINFDMDGNFVGIRFDYWPWKRRKTLDL